MKLKKRKKICDELKIKEIVDQKLKPKLKLALNQKL